MSPEKRLNDCNRRSALVAHADRLTQFQYRVFLLLSTIEQKHMHPMPTHQATSTTHTETFIGTSADVSVRVSAPVVASREYTTIFPGPSPLPPSSLGSDDGLLCWFWTTCAEYVALHPPSH